MDDDEKLKNLYDKFCQYGNEHAIDYEDVTPVWDAAVLFANNSGDDVLQELECIPDYVTFHEWPPDPLRFDDVNGHDDDPYYGYDEYDDYGDYSFNSD